MHADLVTPAVFGPVDREIGGGQQLKQVTAVHAEDRDADGDRHVDRIVIGVDRHDAGPVPEPLGDHARLVGVGAGQQDDELLAAEPPHYVRAAHLLAQLGGETAQHLIPREVPIGVVDPLEVVHIAQQQRETLAGP